MTYVLYQIRFAFLSALEISECAGVCVSLFSHQLCLEGNPDVTILDPEFREFWFKVDKNSPKAGGITRRFHSWSKLSRVLATMLKFIDTVRQGWSRKTSKKPTKLKLNLKVDKIDRNKPLLNTNQLSIDQIKRAEMLLFRIAQYCEFKDEILSLYTSKKVEKSSHLVKLRPVWDQEDSVIRMTGRSPSSSLIILPKANRISELFVLGTHQALHHLGTLPLMSTIEDLGFYLVGGKCEYKRIVRCCICKPPKKLFQEMD